LEKYLRQIPNILSLARLFMVVPVVFAIAQGHYGTALWVFLLAGFTDAIDGFIARKYAWQSELGSLLDPLADKTMIVATFMSLALLKQIPLWLFLVVLFRDLIILAGVLIYHLRTSSKQMHPTIISKANTGLQVFLVLCVLINAQFANVPDMFLDLLIVSLLITSVFSCVRYIQLGFQKVKEHDANY